MHTYTHRHIYHETKQQTSAFGQPHSESPCYEESSFGFSTIFNYFQLTMDLLECNPIVS